MRLEDGTIRRNGLWFESFSSDRWEYAVGFGRRLRDSVDLFPPYMPHTFGSHGTWWWEWDEDGEPIAWFNVDGSLIPGRPSVTVTHWDYLRLRRCRRT